jgi:endonuclease G
MARLTGRRRIAAPAEMDPMAPAGGRPVLTDDNVERIAAVLADPATAWRGEPTARKIAHARQHGVTMPADTDEEQVDVALEQLIGDDNLVPSVWVKRAAAAADTVALLRTPRGPATGFLVSDHLLLTNWHVFKTAAMAADDRVSVVFRYEEGEGAQIRSAVTLGLDPDRFFAVGDEELDFALVAVRPLPNGRPPGSKFGSVRLNGAVGKVLLGMPVNIVQHPGGTPRKIAFRSNPLVSLDDATRLVYQTDTLPGSSGSPVFNDRWQLVALHHRSEQATDASGTQIDLNGRPVTPATPDHLRNWVANAGIRVSRLVGHLEGLQLDGEAATLLGAVLGPLLAPQGRPR